MKSFDMDLKSVIHKGVIEIEETRAFGTISSMILLQNRWMTNDDHKTTDGGLNWHRW